MPNIPNEDLYIGATNWANLQQQYTPYQLSQATQNVNGNIYWNPNVNITDIPTSGELGSYVQDEDENVDLNDGADVTMDTTGGGTNWGQYFQNMYNSSIQNIEQGLLSYNAQQLQANEAAQQKAQTKADEALTGLEGAYETESGETLLKRLMGEQDLQGKMDKLTELKSQLAQLEGDFNIANQQIEAKPIGSAIIRGQKFLKYREYAARSSVIGAQAAIAQEQFSMARDIVQDYYSAATLERENEITRYSTLLSLAKSDVIRLDGEEKEYINSMVSTLQAKQTREKAELDDKMNMINQAAQLGIDMVGAGVSFDDDLETIFNKINPMIATEMNRRQMLSETSGSGTTASGISGGGFTDVMQAAIDAGLTPEQAAREAAIASEEMGIPVSQKQLTEYVKQAGLLTKTPQEPEKTPTPKRKLTAFESGEKVRDALPYFEEEMRKNTYKLITGFYEATVGKVGEWFAGVFGAN